MYAEYTPKCLMYHSFTSHLITAENIFKRILKYFKRFSFLEHNNNSW